MADITLTIPNDKIPRVLDAYAAMYGWTAESGITKSQFAKQQIVRQIKQTVKTVEGDSAANTQRNTIESDVESINIT